MKLRLKYLIPKQLKLSLAGFAFLLLCYELLRLGFLIANRQYFSGVPAGQVLWAFVYGLRFDLSALLMLNAVILLLYNLPGNPARFRWYSSLLLFLFFAANLAAVTVNLADYGYYGFTQRRLMFELFAMPGEILEMLPGLLSGYWHLFLLLASAMALFVYAGLRLFKTLDEKIPYKFNIFTEPLSLILIAGLAVLGIRGGLQSKPIRQNHAFFCQSRAAGYLALNSTFTVLRSLSQPRLSEYQFMPRDSAQALIEEMVRDSNEAMPDREYPFLRQRTATGPERRLNLVIFIMESWSAGQVGPAPGRESATPFFDSLARQGMLFTNFMANSQRSLEAVPAILTSIPAFYNQYSFINSQAEMNRVLGLGHILLKRGYTTSFHHGAKTGSMGFDAYARTAGFLKYFGKEDFPGLADSVQDGTWGVYDEEFFGHALSRMNGFNQPFASVIFSLSPHDPLTIPEYRESLFGQYKEKDRFRKTLRYSDYSLKTFFEKARGTDWLKNTVFVITGDHPYHSMREDFASVFRVPLLIYCPGLLGPDVRTGIASQVDVMPTILSIMNLSTVHASMGGSLMSVTKGRYAILRHGSEFAILDDRLALTSDLEKVTGLYDYRNDPGFKNNLKDQKPEETTRLFSNLKAYIQQASYAIARDRICREGDVR
jgi:phosphoglycerol transferase MdoB-like AlkP superfamily enzyme